MTPHIYRISVGSVNRTSVDGPWHAAYMETVGDRLKRVRKAAKLSRREVAERLGTSYSTVASHENGQTEEPRGTALKRYAKLYKKTPHWLLTGDGPADAQNLVPLMGRIGAGGDIDPEFEQVPDDGLDEIQLPINVGVDAIAFEVSGTSMKPRYDQGVLIICTRDSRDPESLIGTEVAVRTSDNKRFLKTLRPGRKRGLFTLESFNADPITDVRLVWVGEILAVIPAHRRVATAMLTRRTG